MKINDLYEAHEWEKFVNYIQDIARVFTFEKNGEDVNIHPTGEAWIVFEHMSSSLGKWLLDSSYPGATLNTEKNKLELVVQGPYKQSYTHRMTHARKMASILNAIGVQCAPAGKLE